MKPRTVRRGEPLAEGEVLAQDVRGPHGVAFEKGRVLSEHDLRRLEAFDWAELHVLSLEAGDLHEQDGGRRIAQAVAGPGVEVKAMTGGAFPLAAQRRGIVRVDAARLAHVNELDDMAVYSLPEGYVAVEGETVGNAKIVPFVAREDRVAAAEALSKGGLLSVDPFLPMRVALLVDATIDAEVAARARRALEEKLAFFGAQLVQNQRVEGGADALAAALRAAVAFGAELIVLAGSRPMDPLDPSLQGLERAGVGLEKHGVPMHPGTLLWVAYAEDVPLVGAPNCGLFAKATAFDVVLPRLLAGEHLDRGKLASFGTGGLLTGAMSFRFPPYRASGPRGTVDAG
jgi:molybdopterin biosynthesis enzyme